MTANRKEHLATAGKENFDLVVVGGGITGGGIVRDAALRGLKCLLVEKFDFSSGTSSKSGKLIHGGLRYLKYLHLGLVHESCYERDRLLRIVAPHIVRPIRFVMPFYKTSHTPRWVVTLGLYVYGLLALFRNVERFHFISKEQLAKMEPDLLRDDCVGGLSYSDCNCLDTRLTIDTLKSAADAQATLLNYCEVKGIAFDKQQVVLQAKDTLTGKSLEIRARAVVNAGGAWADDILAKSPLEERFHLKITCGIHLIINREKLNVANTLGLEHPRDLRNLYVVPWGDSILVGTTDTFYEGDKNKIPVLREQIDYLLELLNHYFPTLHLSTKDIQGVFAGIRPLIGSDEGKSEDEIPRDFKIITDSRGLVSITGGKLTTYRLMAKKAVNDVIAHFFQDRKLRKCQTLSPISGGDLRQLNREKLYQEFNVNSNRIDLLIKRYGTNARHVLDYTKIDPQKSEVIAPGLGYLWAELDYMVNREYAEKLSDIMFRRTQIYHCTPDHGVKISQEIAAYLGKEKGWSSERIQEEVNEYTKEVEFLKRDLKNS